MSRFRVEFVLTCCGGASDPVGSVATASDRLAASGVAAAGLVEEVYYLIITFRHTGLHGARSGAEHLAAGACDGGDGAGPAGHRSDTGLGQRKLWDNGLLLAAAVPTGAIVFGVSLLLAWLASGRKPGAETFMLSCWAGWCGHGSGASRDVLPHEPFGAGGRPINRAATGVRPRALCWLRLRE